METTLFHNNGRILALLLLVVAADFATAQGPQQPTPGYPTSFSPSMAIVIVVLIAAFFFLGFFSIYIRHCYGDGSIHSAGTALPTGGAAARSRRQRGLDAAVIETFPTMAYADVKEHKAIKGALRSKSSRAPARFPRSHSTGHSLAAALAAGAAPGASERFTLRLPDHVLLELANAGKLQRTRSLVAFRTGSTRRGARVAGTGEGSNRGGRSIRLGQSGRWPSFLSRTFSARLPAWGSRSSRRGDAAADGSSKGGNKAAAGA